MRGMVNRKIYKVGDKNGMTGNHRRPYGNFILSLIAILFVELSLIGGIFIFSAEASSNKKSNYLLEPSVFLQVGPEITLSKLTNGPGETPQDDPFILVDDTVNWTYIITNTGTVPLNNLLVIDDNGTPGDIGDDFSPCSFAILASGASQTCTYEIPSISIPHGALAGAYTNSATVSADDGIVTVTDTDLSSYFGAAPAINIIKTTNGVDANTPPGPTVAVGSPINWNYLVQNTGNVSLTQIAVLDSMGVIVTCPQSILGAGESMNCTAAGVAQAGQYSNTGTVSAQPPVGPAVTDSDLSHYFGQGPTNTATATRTSTATMTPTVTGTPPTPTATGTITPNPILTVSVSPLQSRVNQALTFTIRVTNPGTAPALSAILTDSFPTFIDVISVTFDEGVVTKSIHSVSVNLGDLAPGANTTITILTRVNSSLPRSQTLSNIATLTYNTSFVRTASVVYSVILSTVLPGTGELPISLDSTNTAPSSSTGFLMIGLVFSMTFFGLTIKKSDGKGLLPLLGVLFILVILFVAACSPPNDLVEPVIVSPQPSETSTPTLMPYMPAYRFSTPEIYPTMPEYPIPSPTVVPSGNSNSDDVDTSPVIRVVIPSLDVDAIVRYVPFQGNTWPVEALRDEVAWLGNSSWPGLGGNTVLAGHITVKGIGNGPFRYLDELAKGDQVIVYTENNAYTYETREQITVEETDLGVTLPTTNTQLTLITCTGWDNELSIYRFRKVVFADLISSQEVSVQGHSR